MKLLASSKVANLPGGETTCNQLFNENLLYVVRLLLLSTLIR